MTPESVEVKMLPAPPLISNFDTAVSFVPSLLDAIDFQSALPADTCSVQLWPESLEVAMVPMAPTPLSLDDTAASLVPSLLDAIEDHRALP